MTSGVTIAKTKTAIQTTSVKIEAILSVWGFGSFFRSKSFKDIDLLVVTDSSDDDLLQTSKAIRIAFRDVECELRVPLDITILTEREYDERPLREMDQLRRLYSRKSA